MTRTAGQPSAAPVCSCPSDDADIMLMMTMTTTTMMMMFGICPQIGHTIETKSGCVDGPKLRMQLVSFKF